MSEFDKWWEENYMNVSADRTEAEDIYSIGSQSQQAKIDELQARIDEVLERMDVESSNSWGLWKEKADMYEQGASDAYEKSYWILKGNKDEN